MKKINVYNIFLILLGFAFVYVLYNYSENGRYQFPPGDNVHWMIDTKTGDVYYHGAVKYSKGWDE